MMRIFSTVLFLFVALTVFPQTNSFEAMNNELFISMNRSKLGKGDYNGLMNEFGYRKYLNFCGFETSINYVVSAKEVPYNNNSLLGNSHSNTLSYLRLNFFIIPIVVKKLSFDIGAGGLLGFVSNVTPGSTLSGVLESRYDIGWRLGYNIRLNLKYQISNYWGLSANAGFDALTDGHTNFFYGIIASRRIY